MEPVDFKDDLMDPARAAEYSLVMELSDRSFSYAVFSNENKLLRLKEVALETASPSGYIRKTEEILQKIEELKLPFKDRKVVYSPSKYTLVPSSLFDKSKLNEIYGFNFHRTRDEEVNYDEIPSKGIMVVYAQPFMFKSMLMRLFNFKPFQLGSHISGLLSFLLNRNSEGNIIYLNLRDLVFDLVYVDHGQLVFANCFKYISPEDVSFYSLNLIEQLKLNKDIPVMFYGKIIDGDPVYSLLKKYLSGLKRGEQKHDHPEMASLLSSY